VKDISDELGIPYQLLCKWRSKYLKEGMDSFPGHGNLKESGYKSKIEAKRKIFEYIEYFYNSKRLHSFLGYYTPREYLEKYYRGYYKWTGHEVQVLRIA
jgi:transposase InsO family protein